MESSEAIAYLDRHVNLEVVGAGHVEGLSLETITALLAVFGDPQSAYPVIHVTGTNGKGSVCRIISALLREHGMQVGSYTSPHLSTVNERLQWDLAPIDDEEFGRLIGNVAAMAELASVEPSYFELLTAAAFSWFAELAVDVAVVEVGMLGRFDATNVVNGAVAVVTNVSADHTDRSEGWREAIAREKAGIVKPGSMLVLGNVDADLRPIFEAERPAGTLALGTDFEIAHERVAVGGQVFDLRGPTSWLEDLFIPLHGRHQVDNAAVAIAAVEAFFGRPLDADVVRAGLAEVEAPGRFEILGRRPLVVVDGAHNSQGAAAAATTLADGFDVAGQTILVVGLLDGPGRDVHEILGALGAAAADLVVACAPDSPRAVPPDEIASAARAVGAPVEVVADPEGAVSRALAVADEEDAVLVAGSLYLVDPARAAVAAWTD